MGSLGVPQFASNQEVDASLNQPPAQPMAPAPVASGLQAAVPAQVTTPPASPALDSRIAEYQKSLKQAQDIQMAAAVMSMTGQDDLAKPLMMISSMMVKGDPVKADEAKWQMMKYAEQSKATPDTLEGIAKALGLTDYKAIRPDDSNTNTRVTSGIDSLGRSTTFTESGKKPLRTAPSDISAKPEPDIKDSYDKIIVTNPDHSQTVRYVDKNTMKLMSESFDIGKPSDKTVVNINNDETPRARITRLQSERKSAYNEFERWRQDSESGSLTPEQKKNAADNMKVNFDNYLNIKKQLKEPITSSDINHATDLAMKDIADTSGSAESGASNLATYEEVRKSIIAKLNPQPTGKSQKKRRK